MGGRGGRPGPPCRWSLLMLTLITVTVTATLGWTPRNGSRIQINSRPVDVTNTVFGTGRGQSSIKLGGLKNRLKEPVQLSTTPAATTTSTERFRRQQLVPRIMARRLQHQNLTVGLVLPYKSFDTRIYTKEFSSAIHALQRSFKQHKNNIFKNYDIHHIIDMKQLTPTPTGQ
ncbi:Hypothetical protein CINCED_3A015110 [Cinara cedri]|uniref:Uncharacterized protein n=1 Tax=Cinara cedri TaxID=506608 RepID=A0A5E4NAM5_9HEMI|nr:Hypothetical protein CINCED_3A015110 [Cinara cedri]